jgi:fermentation-respiration switch protein FrsA (DUF1100 family)
MALENFRATTAPKELWIVKDATHAESYWINPQVYQQRIVAFLNKYFYHLNSKGSRNDDKN